MADTPKPTPPQTPTQDVAPAEPMKAPALPYTFKATLRNYWRLLGVPRILLAFALTFIFWFRFGPVVWILSTIGLAIVILLILHLLSARRVTITPDGFDYKGGLGGTRTIRFDQIEGVKVFINYLEPGFGATPRVAVAVKDGMPVNFTGLYWSGEELDKLLAVLAEKKITTEYYEDMVVYQTVAKQFPTYASYIERHTGFVALTSVIGIVVVIVAIALWVTFS